MMKTPHSAMAFALFTTVLAGTAGAATLAYDGFDYDLPDEQISNKSGGGTGWVDASWSQTGGSEFRTLDAGGLSYGSLATAPGQLSDASVTGNAGGISRSYQAADTDSASVFTRWFSVLIQTTSLPDNLGTALGGGLGAGFLGAGDSGTGFLVTYDGGSDTYQFDASVQNNIEGNSTKEGDTSLTLGGTMLLVGKVFNNGNSKDEIALWLDPTDASLGGADLVGRNGARGYVVTNNTFASGGQIGNSKFLLDTNTALFTGGFDEVRVGETFADVTPVPEPVALSAVGLLGLLGLRRRR